jgi:hypothetical protein
MQRMTALGWAKSIDSPRQAASHFRAALKRDSTAESKDPTAESARFGLLLTQRSSVEANDPAALELAQPLEGAAAAVVSGWRLAAAGDWSALRALEPALASAEWFDPAYRDAQRLRVRWRAASDDPLLHAESVEITRELLLDRADSEDLLVATEAFASAGHTREALQLLDSFSTIRRNRQISRIGISLLDALPTDFEPAYRAAIRDRLTKIQKPVRGAAMAGGEREKYRGAMDADRQQRAVPIE